MLRLRGAFALRRELDRRRKPPRRELGQQLLTLVYILFPGIIECGKRLGVGRIERHNWTGAELFVHALPRVGQRSVDREHGQNLLSLEQGISRKLRLRRLENGAQRRQSAAEWLRG